MRLYGLARREIEAIVSAGEVGERDKDGRPIFVGESDDGRRIEVVVALDDGEFVITVFEEGG